MLFDDLIENLTDTFLCPILTGKMKMSLANIGFSVERGELNEKEGNYLLEE